MRYKTSTSGKISATFFDYAVFYKERNFLKVTVNAPNSHGDYTFALVAARRGGGVDIANYWADTQSHSTLVDVSDLVGSGNYTSLAIKWSDSASGADDSIMVDWALYLPYNPDHFLPPSNFGASAAWGGYLDYEMLTPPAKILQFGGPAMLSVEIGSDMQIPIEITTTEGGEVLVESFDFNFLVESVPIDDIATIQLADNTETLIELQPMDCYRRYCVVEWTGRLGTRKRAAWEVASISDKITEQSEIQGISGELYRRGHVVQVVKIRLDNLSEYDAWYYSDILTSDKIRVSLTGEAADLQPAQIQDKETKKTVQGLYNSVEYVLNIDRYGAGIF